MNKTNLTLSLFFCIFLILQVRSQSGGIGIGTEDVDPSAVLEIKSNNKGLLLPRVSSHGSVASAKDGLVVYDVAESSFYIHSGGDWYQLNPMPKGGIIMWSGTTPPKGWALCDGTQGTPNLEGRFIVGYDPDRTDYDRPGNRSSGGTVAGDTGGLEFVPLTTSQIPSHRHSLPSHSHGVSLTTTSNGSHSHQITARLGDNNGTAAATVRRTTDPTAGGTNYMIFDTSSDGAHTHSVSGSTGNWSGNSGYVGNGTSPTHENRPPYYVLAFIMKL